MNIKVVKEYKLFAFFHGMIFWSCINSLLQDMQGKEKYIENCDNNWIDASVSVPIAVICIILIFVDLFIRYKRERFI